MKKSDAKRIKEIKERVKAAKGPFVAAIGHPHDKYKNNLFMFAAGEDMHQVKYVMSIEEEPTQLDHDLILSGHAKDDIEFLLGLLKGKK